MRTHGPAKAPRDPRLVLASASPRRRELLEILGVPLIVRPARVDETPFEGEPCVEYSRRMAELKAGEVARAGERLPVLGSDTVVEIDGTALGKPRDVHEARMMLSTLSGRTHRVHTAVALAHSGRLAALVDSTTVTFRSLAEREIAWYVESTEAYDKAGAYAIQGRGGLFVERIEGSPHTVVGLPVQRLGELFGSLGLRFSDLLVSPRR